MIRDFFFLCVQKPLYSTETYDLVVISLSYSLVPKDMEPLKACYVLQLQENERKLHRSLQEVKNVEFELEEAASRKKVHEYPLKFALIKIQFLYLPRIRQG